MTRVGTETVVFAGGQLPGYLSNVDIATFAESDGGGWVTAWQLQTGSDPNDIYVQRFTSLGVAIGSPVKVNGTTSGDQTNPKVITLPGGRYVVTWDGTGPSASSGLDEFGIFQRIYNADG